MCVLLRESDAVDLAAAAAERTILRLPCVFVLFRIVIQNSSRFEHAAYFSEPTTHFEQPELSNETARSVCVSAAVCLPFVCICCCCIYSIDTEPLDLRLQFDCKLFTVEDLFEVRVYIICHHFPFSGSFRGRRLGPRRCFFHANRSELKLRSKLKPNCSIRLCHCPTVCG